MATVVVDTSVLIALSRRHFDPSSVFRSDDKVILPTVAYAEYMTGVSTDSTTALRDERLEFMKVFRKICDLVDFGEREALQFANLIVHCKTSGTPRGPIDLQIAAHALAASAEIVSLDKRAYFEKLPGVKVRQI